MRGRIEGVWAVPALALLLSAIGCGTPGAPQPPSLNLPERVTDLEATRAGNRVSLTWTMPKKNTDKLILKDKIAVKVCRSEETGACMDAGAALSLPPGKPATFTETLPAALDSGDPRTLRYFVELKNKNGRSAGLSNVAIVVAGKAPEAVEGLKTEVQKAGVILHWTGDGETTAVRLQRTLLTPPAPKKSKEGLLEAPEEPKEQNLLIENVGESRALDKTVHFGESYEYRAQRVARVSADGRTWELAGELSAPVRVDVQDVFPPAVPTGLAAVGSIGENGTGASIDLSWQPDSESDVAGYVVYRREGEGAWQRISPAEPVVGPGFHDAQVTAGHTYRYAVSAVDQSGHESARSAGATETVPTQ